MNRVATLSGLEEANRARSCPRTSAVVVRVVGAIGAGKRVGGALYLHVDAIDGTPRRLKQFIKSVARAASVPVGAFNVVKIEGNPPLRVSLLAYEDFAVSPFPALLDSWTIHLGTSQVAHRTYRAAGNPPVLHRKELLLPSDDPRRQTFSRLTKALEALGLFSDAKSIGFRKQWQARLDQAGVQVRDHKLVQTVTGLASKRATLVERHRTAISRNQLSVPMQALARYGLLDGSRTVLDYGCGRGDDVAVLSAAGIRVAGWDPHFMPHGQVKPADVVNLGYVLNVIEEPHERIETVREAFKYTRQCLAASVMIVGKGNTSGLTPYRDGFLSTRGTFQKYFSQEEARAFLEDAVEQEAIAVGPGMFFLFRDKVEEQRFLANRHRRAHDISHFLMIVPSRGNGSGAELLSVLEENRELVESLWKRTVELGRVPHPEELPEYVARGIEENLGSIRRGLQLAQQTYDPAALTQARTARIDDLKVYIALNLFNRRMRCAELPHELQRDIKAFFGSYSAAEIAGRDLLFTLGKPEALLEACAQAATQGLGHLFGRHSLQLHIGLIDRLPPPLRAYIGCAEKVYGDIAASRADLVKIHIQSGKLTLLKYDDFAGKPLPKLLERIKIKMRERDIDFFDYDQEAIHPPLYMKSRYMAPDQAGYEIQRHFDDSLDGLGIFDFGDLGPSANEFADGLARVGCRVKDFDLVRTIEANLLRVP